MAGSWLTTEPKRVTGWFAITGIVLSGLGSIVGRNALCLAEVAAGNPPIGTPGWDGLNPTPGLGYIVLDSYSTDKTKLNGQSDGEREIQTATTDLRCEKKVKEYCTMMKTSSWHFFQILKNLMKIRIPYTIPKFSDFKILGLHHHHCWNVDYLIPSCLLALTY